MDLRHQQSKLQSKVKSLEDQNRDLKSNVKLLEKKNEVDCKTILDQLKTLSGVEQAYKHVMDQYEKVKKNLKKANKLFKSTLKVKISYEEVIMKLIEDPITSAAT